MNKCVISGGSCSGKSSIIEELKKRGHYCIEEVARAVIEKRNHLKIDLDEIITRQELVFEKQLELEKEINGESGICFLDRGLIDNIAFSKYLIRKIPYRIDGINLDKRYDIVFVPELLDYVDDGLRIESDETERKKIHDLIYETYKEFGYNPIKIPVMPVGKRADFIIDWLKGG